MKKDWDGHMDPDYAIKCIASVSQPRLPVPNTCLGSNSGKKADNFVSGVDFKVNLNLAFYSLS